MFKSVLIQKKTIHNRKYSIQSTHNVRQPTQQQIYLSSSYGTVRSAAHTVSYCPNLGAFNPSCYG